MYSFVSADPAATHAFGQALGRRLAAGDVVCLAGDLGAGKTLLVQGLAVGLGVKDEVTSPTFTILQVYDGGRLPLYHFDLYRLDAADQLEDIGFAEYVGGGGVAVIEWADKFPDAMPADRLWVNLAAEDGSRRLISLTPAGERYRALCEEVERLAPARP